MYNNILVPVDGSPLAESVLPHVQAIASGCEVNNVTFLRVVEPFYIPTSGETGTYFSAADYNKIRSDQLKDAEDYVNKLVSDLSYKSRVASQVLEGRAAETIANYAEKHGVDLIIIATHGRSGVSRWVWGSVAERVLRSACVPVLMVRPEGCETGI